VLESAADFVLCGGVAGESTRRRVVGFFGGAPPAGKKRALVWQQARRLVREARRLDPIVAGLVGIVRGTGRR